MSFISKIFFAFIIVITSFCSAEAPHLILYFDINKTLIAKDKVTGKSEEKVLNELLAEKYVDTWDENIYEPISFADYAGKITDSREEKLAFVQRFISFLKESNHPYLSSVMQDFVAAEKALKSSKGMIFPSFFVLLNYLDQEDISYAVILRSYGKELIEVKEEIENIHQLTFEKVGRFQQGTLLFQDEQPISDAKDIYESLKTIGHAAIQDDWQYWESHERSFEYAKPFYVDREDNQILPIFFDDNIHVKSSSENIVFPLNANTGEWIAIEELVETGQVIRVDTLQAILDPYYFVDLVKTAQESIKYQDRMK